LTSTVGVAAASATAAAGVEQLRASQEKAAPSAMDLGEAPKVEALAPAWDAHLDNPQDADLEVNRMMLQTRRVELGIATEVCARFIDACEFVSLGCFCAVSNAMNLLGVKRNSYPFDWVRSSLEGIVHCLDMEFEDFLTYSTYNLSGNYVVFGGTRWGGSFWHHNVETPLTRQDMVRRVDRFYGRGSVAAKAPRVFARVANSSREILAAGRLREALQQALPEAEVYLLLIVDMQEAGGLMAVDGERGRNLLFFGLTEGETLASMQPGGEASFRLTSENYARGVAAGVRCWSGETRAEEVRVFSSLRELSASCVHFDGGDASRELFTPKKFYGQAMGAAASAPQMQHLLARCRVQMFVVPPTCDVTQPMFVECFGKKLRVFLPRGSQPGNALQLWMNDGALSGAVSTTLNGQPFVFGAAVVEEMF